MRGRFHPHDGQLYACGMFAWAGNATQPGGFYRIRYTGQPMHLPSASRAPAAGMRSRSARALLEAADEPARYAVKTWSLKRSKEYGYAAHLTRNRWPVEAATLSEDRRTVTLKLPDLRPTWGMEITCRLKDTSRQAVHAGQ